MGKSSLCVLLETSMLHLPLFNDAGFLLSAQSDLLSGLLCPAKCFSARAKYHSILHQRYTYSTLGRGSVQQ